MCQPNVYSWLIWYRLKYFEVFGSTKCTWLAMVVFASRVIAVLSVHNWSMKTELVTGSDRFSLRKNSSWTDWRTSILTDRYICNEYVEWIVCTASWVSFWEEGSLPESESFRIVKKCCVAASDICFFKIPAEFVMKNSCFFGPCLTSKYFRLILLSLLCTLSLQILCTWTRTGASLCFLLRWQYTYDGLWAAFKPKPLFVSTRTHNDFSRASNIKDCFD